MAIRYRDAIAYGDGTLYVKANLNSSDTKPTTGIATGSIAIETDTGKSYVYDEDSTAWTELKSSGGGGGGGGGGMTLVKTQPLGLISSNSSSEVTTEYTLTVSGVDDYDVLFCIIAREKTKNRNLATVITGILTAQTAYADPSEATKDQLYWAGDRWLFSLNSSTNIVAKRGQYGIYPSGTATYTDGTFSSAIRVKYSGSNTGTIDGNYTAYIYGATLYDLI